MRRSRAVPAAQGERTVDDQGRTVPFSAVRAPERERRAEPDWGEEVDLFNGRDLTGWKPRPPARAHGWRVRDGVLVNAEPMTDLVSERRFTDFRLHAEFRYPEGSSSGIYLRGRCEMQIMDNLGEAPSSLKIGGIYDFVTPSRNAARPAGQWQTAEITLVGRVVTVVLNGERIIDRQTIPGMTGGALDNDEAAPGPIMLQGDHGQVEFRRLTVTVPR